MSDRRPTVLITGCSPPGIGYHLCLAFHARGCRVFATARSTKTLSSLAEKGIEILDLTVDDHQSVVDCYGEITKRLSGRGLDYLVNNAGRNCTIPSTELPMDQVMATFSSNLFAVMDINQTFLPLLLKSHGTIASVGSVAALFPFFWGGAYNASKAALHAYSNTLRVELAPFGVHVLTLVTAAVKSNIARVDRDLAPNSIWRGYERQYKDRLVYSQTHGMDTRQYADEVVPKILGARGTFWSANEIWAGGGIWFLRTANAIDRWFPGGIWRFLVPIMSKTPRAGKKVQKSE